MPRILITPRSLTRQGHPALDSLHELGYEVVFGPPGRQPEPEELRDLVPTCVGWLAGVEPITAEMLQAAPDLKVISRNGVGVDNIDLEAAARQGVKICRTPGANARGVAELTVGLMFSLARSLPSADRALKGGRPARVLGFEILDKTLGVIGCGRIGRLVAEMALGLGMRVLGHDIVHDPEFRPSRRFRYAEFHEVLTESDVISLHCPAHEENRPILGHVELKRVKPGVLLVNTARASLIDKEALAAALASNQVRGAAVDVFEAESPASDVLLADDRVIVTPHIGGYTKESVDRAARMAVENLITALRT